MRNTTTKKSNASSVHPKKDAVTACAWPDPESPGTPLSRPLMIALLTNGAPNRTNRHALCYNAIKQPCATTGQSQQYSPCADPTEAELADAKQRRVHHGATQHPGQQIPAEVARLRHPRRKRGNAAPACHMWPHFPVEAKQNVVRFGGSQQRDQYPHGRRRTRRRKGCLREDDRRAASEDGPFVQ